MATYTVTSAKLSTEAVALSREPAPQLINRTPGAEPGISFDFSWTPVGSNFTWTMEGNTYNSTSPRTPINSPITFTAAVTVPPGFGRSIVRYEWSFGDGVTAVGNPVTHTFLFPNDHARASLCIVDDRGRKLCIGHQLYLFAANTFAAGSNVILVG